MRTGQGWRLRDRVRMPEARNKVWEDGVRQEQEWKLRDLKWKLEEVERHLREQRVRDRNLGVEWRRIESEIEIVERRLKA